MLTVKELNEKYPLRDGYYWSVEENTPGIRKRVSDEHPYHWWHYYIQRYRDFVMLVTHPTGGYSARQKMPSEDEAVDLMYAMWLLGEYFED